MKKRIIKILLIIISIILTTGIILYFKNDNTDEFPHYKQAYYKMEGSMYVIKDDTFDLPLTFIDSNEMSEMSSSENIKSIEVIDNKSQRLNIEKWSIDNKIKGSNYIFRCIQTKVIMNDEGIFKPEKVVITYKDNVTKEYDFGDFSIICYSEDYYSDNLIGGVVYNINPIITSRNIDKFPYSGLSLFIKGYSGNIEVKKIDLGINSFGIDSDNLMNFQSEYDLNVIMNYVEDGLKRKEEWADKISNIKLVDTVDSNIKSFVLEPPKDKSNGTSIILPLTRLKNLNMNEIKVFNIKITLNIAGDEKELLDFQPYYVTPFTFDLTGIYEYLEEEGR